MELNALQRKFIDNKLYGLSKSKFRSSFKLRKKEIKYIKDRGLLVIENHAFDFIRDRLGNEKIDNDGKQTPTKGHPVFIAQHATVTCCRECLYKWYHIQKERKLTNKEIRFIVSLIIEWIKNNMES